MPVLLAFFALLAVSGGASNFEEPAQLVVRTGALAAIGAIVFMHRPAVVVHGAVAMFLGLAAIIILFQLIPLPSAA